MIDTAQTASGVQRLKVAVRGAVQGVGFRPFVYRLATELGLSGWVNNSPRGVQIEAEGSRPALEQFLLRLESERPPRSSIQGLEASWLDALGFSGFEIRESDTGGGKTTLVLPDIATCPDCLREIFDPNDRRYFYPFTNCTHCGPRFSIVEALPYDRGNTSMKRFAMCPRCQSEYDDPLNRRFHAQPNACPVCGPQLALWDAEGRSLKLASDTSAEFLNAAAGAIREGKIVAVKGIGGFHLMVDAGNERAVGRLREVKHREEKPLAVMFPGLASISDVCEVSPLEERLLRSPEAPIVLLQRRTNSPAKLPDEIAPGNPTLGVMLPYSPLHHLLLSVLQTPVVATSGNLSDEPICMDEREAVVRLKGIADLFLVHNRPIVRHVDDSIVRVMLGRELVLRRARGYAPLPVHISKPSTGSVLATGAHLKNAVALSVGPQVFISQHIGDLETEQAHDAFKRVIGDLMRLYETRPNIVAADAHPDYLSSVFARDFAGGSTEVCAAGELPLRLVTVQHHLAHVLSCMAENEIEPPFLGVSWDGTGYGLDGTIWGGEFFDVADSGWERAASFRTFRLPGGDRAVKEPRRTALGLLHAMFGESASERAELTPVAVFSRQELSQLGTMLQREINSPVTSSAGRLFDAVASLIGLRQRVRFEGQAAMELEFAASRVRTEASYEFPLLRSVLDWAPMIESILRDLKSGVGADDIAARFHNSLVEGIVAVAVRAGRERVVLSGGCFQNKYLTERTVARLRSAGFRPYWHQRVPPNDGGICLGQAVAPALWPV